MELEMCRQIEASSSLMRALLWLAVVKKELNEKAKFLFPGLSMLQPSKEQGPGSKWPKSASFKGWPGLALELM